MEKSLRKNAFTVSKILITVAIIIYHFELLIMITTRIHFSNINDNIKLKNQYEYGTEINIKNLNLKEGQELYYQNKPVKTDLIKLDKLGVNYIKVMYTGETTFLYFFEIPVIETNFIKFNVVDTQAPEITDNETKNEHYNCSFKRE